MAFIDSSAIRPKFTSDLVAAYKSSLNATTFLQSKFKRVTKDTDYLEWNIQRFSENVAQDVARGADGNRNSYATMVQKVEQPPLYYEYLDVMQLEGYNRAFGSVSMSDSTYRDFRETATFHVKQMINKIDRAYELQAQSVLLTGKIITATNGTTDFLRKAASIVAYGIGIDWSQAGVNPKDLIKQGCIFNRTVGKASSNVFDCIMGDGAYTAFINNVNIQNEAQKLWSVLTKLEEPTPRGDGSTFMGQISAGPYKVNVFCYPEYYTNTTEVPNTSLPYVPSNAIIITPSDPYFIHGFAMVPRLPDYMGMAESGFGNAIGGEEGTNKGQYFISEFVDMKRTAWYMAAKSAGMTIPIGVDQIFTAYPLAA